MIYGLSSWEKIDRMQPWLFTNGNTVVIQRPKFLTSPATYILGIFLTLFGAVSLAWLYFSHELSFTTINPTHILAGLSIIPGIWLSLQAKTGTELRKEQGGIHPTDTLLVFDGSKKMVFKQEGTAEEIVTAFQDMHFEMHIQRNNKQTQYKIQITHPKGKERIATTSTQASAERITKTIQEKLGITQ